MPRRKTGVVKARRATADRRPLVPTQERSRERLDTILAAASDLLMDKGSDAFRMSDIVARTGIAFGSLYQYFPDKSAVIGALAARWNDVGRDCVARDLAAMTKLSDLHATLCRITDGYERMFRDHPVMHRIWQATQADRTLQEIDAEDVVVLAGLLRDRLHRIAPKYPASALTAFSQLAMIQIAAAVRHTIALPPPDARRVLDLFKRMLPKDLSALG